MSNRSSPLKRRTFGSAVLFLCLLAPLLGHSQEPASVTVCSYNLKNWLIQKSFTGGTDSPGIAKSDQEKEHITRFLKEIQPDILGVCEIGTPEDLADLQTRLKAAGIDLPHTEFNSGGDITRSLALLSRYPITQRHSQSHLEYQMGEETLLMQRGILDATVEITPEFQVRFLGVHLKSKRPTPEADESLMRRNEAHLLRRYMDSLFAKDPQAKLLCYGDFNEHRNEPAISEIIGSRASEGHMGDLLLRDDNGLVWTHFWDAADVYSRFDYFFVSRALRPHVDLKNSSIFSAPDFDKGSDHRPIMTTLRVSASRSRTKAAK